MQGECVATLAVRHSWGWGMESAATLAVGHNWGWGMESAATLAVGSRAFPARNPHGRKAHSFRMICKALASLQASVKDKEEEEVEVEGGGEVPQLLARRRHNDEGGQMKRCPVERGTVFFGDSCWQGCLLFEPPQEYI